MLLHHQLRWLGHVIRMPDSRLPHHVLYGQLRQGNRSVSGKKKCFKDHIKSILKKCNIPNNRLEALASNRAAWKSTCASIMPCFDAVYDRAAALRRRHQHAAVLCPILDSVHQCPLCADNVSHALASTVKPTFNVEEEVVVIRNGWTPKEEVSKHDTGKQFTTARLRHDYQHWLQVIHTDNKTYTLECG